MKKRPSYIEVEGNTVEDAVKLALQKLHVKMNQIKIEVLCEEKKGLFGMAGAKLAKIRVTMSNDKDNA